MYCIVLNKLLPLTQINRMSAKMSKGYKFGRNEEKAIF